MKKQYIFLVLLSIILHGCARSNQYQDLELVSKNDAQFEPWQNHSLAIAFGGGGVRGYMHLGVIKALEENQIKADLVTGSSAGSVAATLYASGQPYEELEIIIDDLNELAITDFVISRRGIVNGQKLAEWVNQSVPQQQLSQMPIPIGITATDMTDFKSILIRDGNPGQAVQTSSTIPGAFIPVEHNDHLLVDGGVLHVVPVEYARSMGADIVIAVDIYCGNQPSAEVTSMKMQLAAFRLLACRLSEPEIQSADILVRPNYEPAEAGLFSDKSAAIQAGYDAMMAQMPQLKQKLKQSLLLGDKTSLNWKKLEL
ncbi:patatin-like phospholipase family protein [Marinomonas epiphytica]